ncbi:MAG: hypothetical protein ACJAVI_001491 [Candidatus Azotimanducaceae bacterium]|jgi:hypothetical protein
MRETDLSHPIKSHLEQMGYRVHAEVKDCDITAQLGNELVIVELKTSVNMTLLIQATARQKITPLVYVAIPEPASQKGSHWKGILNVLSRLKLGLLLVNFNPPGITVKEALSPPGFIGDSADSVAKVGVKRQSNRKSSKKRDAILKELEGRSVDLNEAGSHRRQLVTAYRENAILIACCLNIRGSASTAELRKLSTGKKTSTILAKNYYGWFERVSRGTYQLTDKGRSSLNDYPQLRALSENHIHNINIQLK